MAMPMIGLGLGLVQGVVGAAGAMQTGEAEYEAAMYEADAARANFAIADQERVLNMETAKLDAQDKARENRRAMSSMRASFGLSGGDLMGSPIEVLEDAATEFALDEERIRSEGRARNREGGIAMINARRDERLSISKGKNARRAARVNAFSAILGGVSTGLSRMN